ncbi:MAG: cellulase family glycosylhydrolase [Methylocella sp.]
MNYFDAFYRTVLHPGDTSYRAGFQQLQAAGIPFIRFMVMPFWPNEARAFVRNPNLLFQLLDQFVQDAQTYNIGLIGSVFWNYQALPAVMGEPVGAWGDPNSKTTAFAKSFSQQLAARYRQSPTIWAWEFANEMNAYDDLPTGYEYYLVDTSEGKPAAYTTADNLTSEQMLFAYTTFANAIHAGDPLRLVEPGYALPRNNAYQLRTGRSAAEDTVAQFYTVEAEDNAPGDLSSVHIYPESVNQAYDARFADQSVTAPEFITVAANAGQAACKPMFIGEFGTPDDGSDGSSQESFLDFQALLNSFVASSAPLAAAWVFDFTYQETHDGNNNMTFRNSRADRLNLITQANQSLGASH